VEVKLYWFETTAMDAKIDGVTLKFKPEFYIYKISS